MHGKATCVTFTQKTNRKMLVKLTTDILAALTEEERGHKDCESKSHGDDMLESSSTDFFAFREDLEENNVNNGSRCNT